MRNTRRTLGSALVPALLLTLAQGVAGAMTPDCRLARKHFKDGIWNFESNQWDEAMRHILASIKNAGGCDPDDLRFVVPYGRWRYRFTPEVYLGVALSRSERCDAGKSVPDQECRLADDAWSQLERVDLDCLRKIESANCNELKSAKSARCGPEVDWLLELEARHVRLSLEHRGKQESSSGRLLVSRSDADERALDNDCEELWSLAPFLREAILRRPNRQREICGELLEELRKLLSGARRLCDSRWPRSPHRGSIPPDG